MTRTTKRTSRPQTSEAIMEKWLAKQDRAVEKTYSALCGKRTPSEEKEISAADYLETYRLQQRSRIDALRVEHSRLIGDCFDIEGQLLRLVSSCRELAQIIAEAEAEIESRRPLKIRNKKKRWPKGFACQIKSSFSSDSTAV